MISGVLGEFGESSSASPEVADFVDGTHHLAVDRVVQDFAHEAAVDLEKSTGKCLR
jgi:hypothetical protein